MSNWTAHKLLSKMGQSLVNYDDGRYPDLEQDAMRYWINRDFIAQLAGITPERLDELTDAHINKLLKPFDHEC